MYQLLMLLASLPCFAQVEWFCRIHVPVISPSIYYIDKYLENNWIYWLSPEFPRHC